MNKITITIACTIALATSALAEPPAIYSDDGEFLGTLGSRYEPDSVNNPYGRYGSKFAPDSINNPYGRYGNKFSPDRVTIPGDDGSDLEYEQ